MALGQRLLNLAAELTAKDTTGQVSNAVASVSGSVSLVAIVTVLWNNKALIEADAAAVSQMILGLAALFTVPLAVVAVAPAAPKAS